MTTQRDRLAAVLHDIQCGCEKGASPLFYADADALLARGVRVVDAETLKRALHEPDPDLHEFDTDSVAGVNGRCRSCGEDGVWTAWINADWVLAALDGEAAS